MSFTDRIFPTEADRLAHACGAFDRNQQWKVTATLKIYKIARQGVGGQCWEYLYTDSADPISQASTEDTAIYIDDEADAGAADGTSAHPYATLEAAYAATPAAGNGYAVTWHIVRAGLYAGRVHPQVTLVDASSAMTSLATIAAQAGSSTTALVTAGGLTVNAYRGKTLYRASTGEYVQVRGNDATDITPCEAWSTSVSAGETFTIYEPGVEFAIPADDDGGGYYSMLRSDCDAVIIGVRFATGSGSWPVSPSPRLTARRLSLVACEVASGVALFTYATRLDMGLGALDWIGAGLYVRSGGALASWGSDAQLYIVTAAVDSVMMRTGSAFVRGGHLANLADAGWWNGAGWESFVWVFPGTIPVTIGDTTSTGTVVSCRRCNYALVRATISNTSASNPAIDVDAAGRVSISYSHVTGQNSGTGLSLRLRNGARVWTDGAPAFGRGNGDADYSIDGTTSYDASNANRLHARWGAESTAYFDGGRGSALLRRA